VSSSLPRAPRENLTITQLCRQSGTTPRALRYYEEKGLLSPRRINQARVYSHREKVRLQLILQGRRAGFTLREVRDLFDTYDKGGRDAQRVRALPLFKAQLAALTQRRAEIADALETLKAASARMAVKPGTSFTEAPDQSQRSSESAGRTASLSLGLSTKPQPLGDLASASGRQG
jgi:DNA-binding transcriptional MerR regulator